ncbi:MAG: FtsX-like permease family protein [Ignavibacteriota bacterium]
MAGVMPETFDFASIFAPGSHIDLFEPFPLTAETNRWGNTMAIVARLKPGVSVASAGAEIRLLAGHITQAHPERNGFQGHVMPLADHVSGRMRLALFVLAGAVGVVMLIVCANLSNLLLARTAARQKEIAIRTALGAGQWRLIGQMLTEGVALSCCGALLGVVLAWVGTSALTHLDAINIPLLGSVHVDGAVLAFTLVMAIGTGVLFGLAPALQIPAAALHDVLKDSNRGSTEGKGRGWVRGGLVVSEIAFACMLLVGAGC